MKGDLYDGHLDHALRLATGDANLEPYVVTVGAYINDPMAERSDKHTRIDLPETQALVVWRRHPKDPDRFCAVIPREAVRLATSHNVIESAPDEESEAFDEYLDSQYGTVNVAGDERWTSEWLRAVDPNQYRERFAEWASEQDNS